MKPDDPEPSSGSKDLDDMIEDIQAVGRLHALMVQGFDIAFRFEAERKRVVLVAEARPESPYHPKKIVCRYVDRRLPDDPEKKLLISEYIPIVAFFWTAWRELALEVHEIATGGP